MLRSTIFLTIVAALFFSPASGDETDGKVSLPKRENFHLYLLVGQSNMAGRGKITETDKVPHPRVLMLSKEKEWVPAVDPLHFDKPVAGVGLGRSFARELAKEDDTVTIGLIPCAVGGSPILSWEPGGFHASTKTHPWDDMLPRAEAALEVGVLKGILWHQGESDSKETLAPEYEKRLHALIVRFRSELNAPDVPFIAGGMGEWKKKPWDQWRRMVDGVHRRLPEKIPNTGFVDVAGLKDKDGVHFDRESYIELGRRYAAVYRLLNR